MQQRAPQHRTSKLWMVSSNQHTDPAEFCHSLNMYFSHVSEDGGHVSGEFRVEEHVLSGGRMRESECFCVEGLSGDHLEEGLHLFFLSDCSWSRNKVAAIVCRITKHGVIDVSEVNPDLMCPPCPQPEFQKG